MRLQAKLSLWMACVLAVAGAYLAFQREREQVRESAALIRELKARIAELETAASRQPEIARPDASADPPTQLAAVATPGRDERPVEQRPARSRRVEDSSVQAAAQALWLVNKKAQVRRSHPGIAQELGLTEQQEDALFDLLARQELEQMQRPRMPAPTAENETELRAASAELAAMFGSQRQALQAQLGPENYERYREYMSSVAERRQVQMLHERLETANALSEGQTARLVEAMLEERQRYLREQRQLPGFDGFASEYPFIGITSTNDPVERARFADEQLGRIKGFLDSVHRRAAAVLTPEQLRRFGEIQEEHMAQAVLMMERTRHPPAAD